MPNWRLEIVEEIGSTSTEIAARAAAGEPEGLAILARTQTAGRGRDGRVWRTLPGNLSLSLLLRPDEPARHGSDWPLLAAVAAHDALAPRLPRPDRLRIKWPNDLLLGGAKLGGILIESTVREDRIATLVIGIGINLRAAPAVDRPTACLADEAEPPAPEAVAADLLDTIARRAAERRDAGMAGIRATWSAAAHAPGERLRVRDGDGWVEGAYDGLTAEGWLRLLTADGTRMVRSGDVEDGVKAKAASPPPEQRSSSRTA